MATDWMREVFEPTVRMIPAEYRSQIEPAQFFHEVLTHRWFLAEQAGHDVPMVEAVESYIASVLPKYKLDASMMDAINADADSGVIDDERTLGTNTYGNGVFDADGRPGHPRTADDDDDYNPDDDPDAAVWSH
ncbi:LPS kinase [Bifidobacterium pseudolongum subsp. globosum]|uniref:LPS kinase n=1 Tax=Bifidobacterium pseudolongum subsp. globosum TaxID=1690 RepID=A0A4Q5BAM1_9BIFI|nr:lipopolysaccharide kinase [Bifidobacterium pseudolongum subsp. globosum]RYQ23785.1 LPS kinase [Bifidobacterium pseudolongum subsp. globosum]RYQ54805.1 LPS kinase [Bifidobacterium pseudolongum subsp. globosum]RYQ67554.1 LPS kinase [Bifidobacterium pseudolongum subsp. globosum]RYQ72455.1 LPS kinase [Bifidobacterium pseudolongum subsp. globosum]